MNKKVLARVIDRTRARVVVVLIEGDHLGRIFELSVEEHSDRQMRHRDNQRVFPTTEVMVTEVFDEVTGRKTPKVHWPPRPDDPPIKAELV